MWKFLITTLAIGFFVFARVAFGGEGFDKPLTQQTLSLFDHAKDRRDKALDSYLGNWLAGYSDKKNLARFLEGESSIRLFLRHQPSMLKEQLMLDDSAGQITVQNLPGLLFRRRLPAGTLNPAKLLAGETFTVFSKNNRKSE